MHLHYSPYERPLDWSRSRIPAPPFATRCSGSTTSTPPTPITKSCLDAQTSTRLSSARRRRRHAAATLAALERGLHVFVEKPMCVTLATPTESPRRDNARGRSCRSGYMKRFDRVGADARGDAGVRRVAPLHPCRRTRPRVSDRTSHRARSREARTSPRTCSRPGREQMRAQLREAVGADSPAVITAFEGAFLGSLVHDVNLVHAYSSASASPCLPR